MRQVDNFNPPRYPDEFTDQQLLAAMRAERGAIGKIVEQNNRPRYADEPSDEDLLATLSAERRAATKEIEANPLTPEAVMTPEQQRLGILAVSGVELPAAQRVPEIPMQQVRETAADQNQKAEQIPARVA